MQYFPFEFMQIVLLLQCLYLFFIAPGSSYRCRSTTFSAVSSSYVDKNIPQCVFFCWAPGYLWSQSIAEQESNSDSGSQPGTSNWPSSAHVSHPSSLWFFGFMRSAGFAARLFWPHRRPYIPAAAFFRRWECWLPIRESSWQAKSVLAVVPFWLVSPVLLPTSPQQSPFVCLESWKYQATLHDQASKLHIFCW